jgi:hypothetical protein
MGLAVDDRRSRSVETRRTEEKKKVEQRPQDKPVEDKPKPQTAQFQETRDEFVVARRGGRTAPTGTSTSTDPSAGPATSGVTRGVQGRIRESDRPLHSTDYPSFRASVEATAPAETTAPVASPVTPERVPEDTSVVTPERRAEIDAYNQSVEDEHLEEYGNANEDGERVATALRGDSDLGELNPAEQQYLIDVSLDRWTDKDADYYDQTVNYVAINALADQAANDPNISGAVAEGFATRSAEMTAASQGQPFDFRSEQVSATLATHAMTAAGSPQGRHELLEKIGPENSANLAASLSIELSSQYDGGSFAFGNSAGAADRSQAMGQLLEAASQPPPTSSTQAAVDTAFQLFPSQGYEDDFPGGVAEHMGSALAAHWYPNDPALRDSEAGRLSGVLQTSQGRELLANNNLTLEERLKNLDLVKSHTEWNSEFFQQTDHAYDNSAISFALAGPTAVQYQRLRGDTPLELSGTNLENTIGFAMGFPPQGIPENETEAERDAREAAVAAGQHSYYQGEPASEVVGPVAESIRSVGGDNPQVTVLPVQYASAETGTVNLPLFRVQDPATGADRFVDNVGRTYDSFDDWKNNNELPPGNMTYPVNGHLSNDVLIETKNTPQTADTFGEHVGNFLDHASLVGGIIAGGAILLGSGGTLAPVVLGGAAAWGTFRGAEELNDRWQHGQSLNPITDEGARAAWLGFGANAASVVSLGATSVAGRFAQSGSSWAFPAATAAAYLRVGANVLDAGAALNAGHTLVTHYDELSPSDRAGLALSAGFWGVNMLAGSRVAGARPSEMFNLSAIRDGTLYGHFDTRVQTELRTRIQGADGDAGRVFTELSLSQRFRSMTPDQQLNYLRTNGESLGALSQSTGFTSLAPGSQRSIIDEWDGMTAGSRTILVDSLNAQTTAGGRETLARLATSEGFRTMPVADRELLLRYVGGANAELSVPARAKMEELLRDPTFRTGSPAQQSQRLQDFLRDQPGLPQNVSEAPTTYGTTSGWTMSPGTPVPNIAFQSGTGPATRYDITIDGRTIPVYLSTQAPGTGLSTHSPGEVAAALSRLPPEVRAGINEVRLNSAQNPQDTFWAQQYGDPNFRSYMTADSANGAIDFYPTAHRQDADYLAGSIVHEAGHFASQQNYGYAHTTQDWQNWQTAMNADRLSPSGYGRSSLDEDFAETYALYFQVRGTPREAEMRALLPERFRLIDQMLGVTP